MAIAISDILITQSFGVVVQRINDMTSSFTANVVTTGLLPGGAYTTGNAYVNGMFGSNVLYTTTLAGGNISTNTILLVASNTYVNNYLSIGNNTINTAFGYVTATQTIGSFCASTNSYIQTTTTNSNTGLSASADWVAYNDMSDGSIFIDMGILSTVWSNTQWTIGGANDGYLYTGGGNLCIGTNSSSKYINFFTGGGFSANERMRITDNGVGIKNTNPDATLAVTGTANVSANVRIGGYTTVANSFNVLTVDSNLTPKTTNIYTLGTSANRWASLYVSGSTIYLGTVSLSDSSGDFQTSAGAIINGSLSVNSSITGANTLTVTGNSTFSNTITVTGNVKFSNTLAVTGNVIFANTLAVTGNVTLSNTLTVTGNSTFSNTILVTGDATFSNTISVTNTATFSNTIAVIGNVTFSNTLFVNGAVTVNSSMNVVSNAQFANTLSVTGNSIFSNSVVVTGNVKFSNTLTVTGNSTFSNSVSITGNSTLLGGLNVTGYTSFADQTIHTGVATFLSSMAVNGAITVNNSITANGALAVNGSISVTNSSLTITTNNSSFISVGNLTINTSINATSITVSNVFATNIAGTLTTTSQPNITANNANYLNGNSAATLRSYTDSIYTAAAAYADGRAVIAYANSTAYTDARTSSVLSTAQAYTDGINSTLSTAINQGSANATNLVTGTLPSGRLSGQYTGITAVGTLPVLNANNINGNWLIISNSISVGLNTTVSGNSIVSGNSSIGGDLRVTGNLYVTGTTSTGASAAGDIVPTSNSIFLGSATKRFSIYAMSGDFVNPVTVTNSVSFGNTYPSANGILLGNNTLRWTISANSIDVSSNGNFANIVVTTNSTLYTASINTLYVSGISTFGANTTYQGNSIFNANSTFNGIVTVSNSVSISGNTAVSNYLSVNNTSYMYSSKYNFITTGAETVDSFSATSYRSAEYLIQLSDPSTSSYQVSKILILHDGTSPYITEYAQLYNKSLLGTFSADINAGNVRIRISAATTTVVAALTRTNLVV